MKRQIRCGCYETNSSSTHAICIAKNNPDKENFPDELYFEHGDYGWDNEIYTDAQNRANYLYQVICDLCYKNEVRKSKYLNLLYDVLGKYNIKCDFDKRGYDEDGYYIDGYIDHADEAREFLDAVLRSKKRLLRYLFGDSMIITGNDNEEWFNEYIESQDFSDYEVYYKGN